MHLHVLVDASGGCPNDFLADQRSIPVPRHGMLNLHDVGAPVSEKCARSRNKNELCQLNDTDTVEDRGRRCLGGRHDGHPMLNSDSGCSIPTNWSASIAIAPPTNVSPCHQWITILPSTG